MTGRPYHQLARQLRAAREAARLSQEQAAERAAVSISAVSASESGRVCPKLPLLCRLAGAYETTASALLEGIR